jgi:regulator of cell morphogenesis and NO signaling
MENLRMKSVGEFVAEDYRTASVFQKYGIDFCCKGGKTIDEVCESKKVSADELLKELTDVSKQGGNQNTDFQSWPLDLLADYIEKKHHRYIEQATPALKQFLEKLCKVHGSHNPELFEINEQFTASAGELAMHMKKEELVLFPFIRKMMAAKSSDETSVQAGFSTVQNPIKMMMQEHDVEGERFRKMSSLSDNYTPPSYACNTYKVAYSFLKEFEDDLHLHIHLENNILFPKAIELEEELEWSKV